MSQIKKLFVGGLSYDATQDDVRELFEKTGSVNDVKIIMDRETGRPRGFCFVEMGSPEEAQSAIASLNNTEYMGRNIVVNEAKEKPREQRGSWG